MSVLRLEKVSYRTGQFQLQVDLEIRSKVTGIFGPSGAGKTTLLELIAGLRKPDRGVLTLRDEVVFDSTARAWIPPHCRHIGYVPQDLALFPHLRVRENILYGARGDESQFQQLTSQFQLATLLHRFPANLSGGEKQRVAIVRAFMTKPKLLMLDEPLSNLDDGLKERGLELFRKVRTEFDTPILYVTHDADEIVDLCDEVVVLKNGRIDGVGIPTQFFTPSNRRHHIFNPSKN